MNNSLTGDIFSDMLVANLFIPPGESHCENIYCADSTQNLKLIFVGMSMDYSSFDLFYTIKIEENENSYNDLPTTEEFSWEPMTLPFSSILHFEPGYNVMIDTINYVDTEILFSKGFILNVPADSVIRLNYVSGYNEQLNWRPPLYIYTDESLSNQISPDLWEYDDFTLSEGTYYLVFTDDNFTFHQPGLGYYNCFVYLTKEIYPSVSDTLTLQELLDNSNITEVDYSNDLPFSEQDFWRVNSSAIVMGQNNPEFRNENYIYFAKAYKLTNMQVGDSVNIHVGGEFDIDSYLYIYKKAANGIDYEFVDKNDDSGIEPAFPNGYRDSYLKFFAPEDCDYYIVATTYSSYYPEMNGKAMSTTIWAGEANNEPEINMGTLLSTTASETTISFTLEESEVSDLDRKNALLPLTVTGTLLDHSTVVMNNTPFTWTINTSKAVFTGVDLYALDANYIPAEVEFTYSSIVVEGTAKSAISLYPNPASNYINIDGLEGKEQIFIIDNSGRIVKSVSVNESMQTINIDDLAQGIYLVTIRKENKIEVLKFIK